MSGSVKRVAVMVSGGGTNLQAILDKLDEGRIRNCTICVVISSRSDAYALERAEKKNIDTVVCRRKDHETADDFDNALLKVLEDYKVDYVVLAGFMSILGSRVIEKYENRIINVHPALIPSFCGKGYYGLTPHKAALDYGVKVTGATVHFVNTEPDGGPIILQKAVEVHQDDTPEILQKRVMQEAEWEILPMALDMLCTGMITVEGRKVKFL